jgi:hypothetical protein
MQEQLDSNSESIRVINEKIDSTMIIGGIINYQSMAGST